VNSVDAKTWNESAYASKGLAAQRRYPNEEFLRFMGRRFFGVPDALKREIKILEAGCGSGANLWMIAREGFDAYGIDFAPGAIALCRAMLANWGTTATVEIGDMAAIPFADGMFDAVADVFSAYSLTETQFEAFLRESARVLKPGGTFFCYTPSKRSDMFTNRGTVPLLDPSTLDGVCRESSPYFGSEHPFRFTSIDELASALARNSLAVTYCESVGRTYREGAEYFEWIVVEAYRQKL
jgi:ubiquinone/menaquinone biosynthesis C-methylase UbiE